MPEMTLIVKWPDGLLQECCAPSLALYDHFAEGVTYTVAHFRSQMLDALDGVLGDAAPASASRAPHRRPPPSR